MAIALGQQAFSAFSPEIALNLIHYHINTISYQYMYTISYQYMYTISYQYMYTISYQYRVFRETYQAKCCHLVFCTIYIYSEVRTYKHFL